MIKEIVNVNISETSEKNYPIFIGKDILSEVSKKVKKYTEASKVLIVSNNTVFDIYGEQLKASLDNESIPYEIVLLEDGEKYKNINSLNKIWDKALEYKLERKDALIALGGGVIGDIAGFAASSILRGVDFIQVPTTLLAMVDSSVGGKVAINHSSGKNLIGAFYQPKFVLSDINTLKTLDKRQLKVGLAEVLKYGFIEKSCGFSKECDFLEFLKNNKDKIFKLDENTITNLIKHSCSLKSAVVSLDEKEQGLRKILNFGHTIGHSIEKCTNYEVFNHGEAVAIGIRVILKISKQLELIDDNYYQNGLNLLSDYQMDFQIPENINNEELYNAMFGDKKVEQGKIKFVLAKNNAEVLLSSDVDKSLVLSNL